MIRPGLPKPSDQSGLPGFFHASGHAPLFVALINAISGPFACMAVMYLVYQLFIVNQLSSADVDTKGNTGYFYHGEKDEQSAQCL
jgi:hypothetical protein